MLLHPPVSAVRRHSLSTDPHSSSRFDRDASAITRRELLRGTAAAITIGSLGMVAPRYAEAAGTFGDYSTFWTLPRRAAQQRASPPPPPPDPERERALYQWAADPNGIVTYVEQGPMIGNPPNQTWNRVEKDLFYRSSDPVTQMEWAYLQGWWQISTGVYYILHITSETLNGTPITLSGNPPASYAPLHYAQWNTPDTQYTLMADGGLWRYDTGTWVLNFRHRQTWSPATPVYNDVWNAGPMSLPTLLQVDEWWDNCDRWGTPPADPLCATSVGTQGNPTPVPVDGPPQSLGYTYWAAGAGMLWRNGSPSFWGMYSYWNW